MNQLERERREKIRIHISDRPKKKLVTLKTILAKMEQNKKVEKDSLLSQYYNTSTKN